MTVEPSQARAQLLREHHRLRNLLTSAQAIADRLRDGEPVAGELAAALVRLRDAFAEHNASEEALLEPILRHDAAWGPLRVQRMLEEHADEHAVFRELLSGPDDAVAARLADFAEDVCAHMEAEERTFLHPHVLHDDHLDGRGND